MLRQALKAALAEAILYPGTENFVKFFELQNYFTSRRRVLRNWRAVTRRRCARVSRRWPRSAGRPTSGS